MPGRSWFWRHSASRTSRTCACAARACAMRSSSCWSRSLSSSRSSSSFDAKWCSSPGSLIPTRLAMVARDAPRNPRVAKTSLAAARIASRRSRPLAYPPRSRPVVLTAPEPSRVRPRTQRCPRPPNSKLCALGQIARRAPHRQRVAPVGDDLAVRALVEVGQVGAVQSEGDDRAATRRELDLLVPLELARRLAGRPREGQVGLCDGGPCAAGSCSSRASTPSRRRDRTRHAKVAEAEVARRRGRSRTGRAAAGGTGRTSGSRRRCLRRSAARR